MRCAVDSAMRRWLRHGADINAQTGKDGLLPSGSDQAEGTAWYAYFPNPPPCSTRIHTTFVMHTHTHIHRQSCWKEVRTGPLELRRTHFFGPKNVQQNWTFLGPLFFSGCQKERKKTPQGGEHRSGGVKFGANISLTLTQQTNKQASPTNHILPTVGS